MRGTCSPGFSITARFSSDHVLPTPFGEIAAQTMVPYSHILWSHVWLGIAVDAYERARAFVRNQAKGSIDSLPPTATRLSSLAALLHGMRARDRREHDRVREDCVRTATPPRSSRRSDTRFASTTSRSTRPSWRLGSVMERSGDLRHGRLQERHAVQCRAGTCATRCRER